jgi:hypothetical protein
MILRVCMRETLRYFLLHNTRVPFSFVSFNSYVNLGLKLGQILSSINDRPITLTKRGIALRTRKSDILRNYKCENPLAVS